VRGELRGSSTLPCKTKHDHEICEHHLTPSAHLRPLLVFLRSSAGPCRCGKERRQQSRLFRKPAWLGRIAPWYQAQIDAGALPGAAVAIARQGKLAYLEAIGFQDHAKKIPLQPDAIFWIASMTRLSPASPS
jgi:CubicO group peptidase (beta-lactamase class C family)